MFVAGKRLRAFFTFEGDGRNLIGETICGKRGGGAGLGGEREFVLLVARDLILLRENFRGFAHQQLRHGTEEAVAIHAVDDLLIAEAISPASAIEIKGQARHGFGAAGEHAIEIAVRNLREAEGDGFESRSASLVDGVGRNFFGNPAANGYLPRWIWTAASLARIAEDGFFDLFGRNCGAFDGGFGDDGTHVSGGLGSERAAEFTNGRAGGRQNEDVGHEILV